MVISKDLKLDWEVYTNLSEKEKELQEHYEKERIILTFTNSLSLIMQKMKWNQKKLASILGVSPSYIAQLLSRHKNPSLQNIAGMLVKLGIRAELCFKPAKTSFKSEFGYSSENELLINR
jgi:transcriptional regulator with XRE-family HTH domain